MLQVLTNIQAFFMSRRDDEGATAVEYGLMVALIAVAIIVTVTALGGHLSQLFSKVDGKIAATT